MDMSHRALALAVLLAAEPAVAGAIRPTRQMGPMARRLLTNIRQERVRRDQARQDAEWARRVAVVEVETAGDDPDVAAQVARTLEAALRHRGFLVRPYRRVRERMGDAAGELLRSDLTLRQLARRLRSGRLVRVEVKEFRVADGHTAAFAVPSWWGKVELDQEFAEVHLRMRMFEAGPGEVTVDRQDRQHLGIAAQEGDAAERRTFALRRALDRCVDHLLLGIAPQGPALEAGAPEAQATPEGS
jgi:hypothetical protein